MFTHKASLPALGLILASSLATGTDVPSLELKPVPASAIFAPVGFDSNDEVAVILDGYLPDPCHKLRQPDVQFDAASGTFTVMPMAALVRGACPDVTVPFQQTVRLGTLAAGQYRLRQYDGTLGETMTVKPAKGAGPDDFLYAPVENVNVVTQVRKTQGVLSGRFTNTCLAVESVKVVDSGKTIEVLPIAVKHDRSPEGGPCRSRVRAFEMHFDLPAKAAGRYLLHVRSMNGQSVNHVYSVE